MIKRLFRKKPLPIVLDADAPIHKDGVLTENFGIKIYDGSVARFASLGESYPCANSFTFSTDEDNQDQITLFFYRGIENLAQNCSFLGECRLRGFDLAPAEEPLVRLHFRLDNNKIELWAEDEIGSNEISITVVRNADGTSVQ